MKELTLNRLVRLIRRELLPASDAQKKACASDDCEIESKHSYCFVCLVKEVTTRLGDNYTEELLWHFKIEVQAFKVAYSLSTKINGMVEWLTKESKAEADKL